MSMAITDCRISVKRRTARWDTGEVTAAEAMDFWAFAAGAANVIMQLSRPEVGYGVVESKVDSGNVIKHPWKRARTTFQYVAVAVLGSEQDRAAFRAAVDGVHRHVRSTAEAPCGTTHLTPNCRCGWRRACMSVWKTPTNCCAAR
jgi:uncharacterized protein (DUF2236 family)